MQSLLGEVGHEELAAVALEAAEVGLVGFNMLKSHELAFEHQPTRGPRRDDKRRPSVWKRLLPVMPLS